MGLTQWWRRLTGKKQAGKKLVGKQQNAPRAGGGASVAGRGRAGGSAAHSPSTHAQPTGRPGRQAPVEEALPVLGVEATGRAGWVGVLLDASGHGTPHVLVGQSVADLVEQAGAVTVVAVGVPMGLADASRREADVQTRRFLGPRASSVVPTPVRAAVYAESFGEANAVNREKIGAGVAQQAYALRRRVMELDAWLRQDLPHRVVEVQPEASLAVMAGAPLASRRTSAQGAQERRDVLSRAGIYLPTAHPHGVGVEELVGACAAAWSAHRVKTGQARTFPEQPETFSDGIPAAIHA